MHQAYRGIAVDKASGRVALATMYRGQITVLTPLPGFWPWAAQVTRNRQSGAPAAEHRISETCTRGLTRTLNSRSNVAV